MYTYYYEPDFETNKLGEEICLLNILLDFSPNNLFAIRLCTIVNWAGPKKL